MVPEDVLEKVSVDVGEEGEELLFFQNGGTITPGPLLVYMTLPGLHKKKGRCEERLFRG